MTAKTIIAGGISLALLSACGASDVILPGERLDIRAGFGPTQTAAPEHNEARPLRLAPAQVNADWTHRSGDPAHFSGHPALGADLGLAFAADIGAGDSRRARITADPVVAGGRVFTLDSRAQVVATSTGGERLWSTNVTPGFEDPADVSGGGLAYAGGRLYVTTGFGELTALDAGTGREIWTQDLDAPGGGAPTVVGDLVYLVARDSRAWAIDAATGRIRWTLNGIPSLENFSAGAGVAVANDLAVLPFPSGELVGAFPKGGSQRWSTIVAGKRPGRAASTLSDIAGDPVIAGNRVYAGNVSGRVVALETATGSRLWTAQEGALGPLWLAGEALFFVNDLGQLVRLDAANGEIVWRVQIAAEGAARRQRRGTTAHYGPVLAGGRLIVTSSDGVLRQFDPVSGGLVGTVELPGGATTNPAVAGGVLYVVNSRGQLLAFR